MKRYKQFLVETLIKFQEFLMSDKMQHFVWAYFFVTVLLFFVQMKVLIVVFLTLGFIAAKEYLIDKLLKGGAPSKKDMLCGVAGLAVGLLVYFFRMT